IAYDPGQVLFLDDMLGIGGPEALRVKLLERPAREFEPALACFRNCRRRVHGVEISSLASSEQAGSFDTSPSIPLPGRGGEGSQIPSFVNRLFTSLKWKSSEQSFSSSPGFMVSFVPWTWADCRWQLPPDGVLRRTCGGMFAQIQFAQGAFAEDTKQF